MDRRFYMLALLSLAIMPACQKKKTVDEGQVGAVYTENVRQEVDQEPVAKTRAERKESPGSIFGDDLDSFVLDDEDENPFSAPIEDDDDINLIEQDLVDDVWIDKRLEAVQQHGLKAVYFDFDGYVIRPDQKATVEFDLKKIIELTKKGKIIVVEGHSCRFAGSSVYNMMLSERRAQQIAHYLIAHGVARDKIKVVGRGYEMCIVTEGDKEQQSVNRRVEFYVLDDSKA